MQQAGTVVWLTVFLSACQLGMAFRCDEDGGWKFVNGSCIKIYADKLSWEDAKESCERANAHLVSVISPQEQVAIWEAARKENLSVWVGLRTKQMFGQTQLVWVEEEDYVLEYTKTFWGDNQPGDLRTDNCLAIQGQEVRMDKSWQLKSCADTNGYICQKGICEDGWLTKGKQCFKIYSDMTSWYQSNVYCQSIGGQLLKLVSISEQNFIQRYISDLYSDEVTDVWIGITDNKVDNGPLQWSDGSQIGNFTFWPPGAPTINTAGRSDCGYIQISDDQGYWQVTDCTLKKARVCSIPANTPVRPVPTKNELLKCEDGWVGYKGTCYFFSDEEAFWSTAQLACRSHNASLVVIKGDDIQCFISGVIADDDYWIGLSYHTNSSDWRWEDETELNYTHWSPEGGGTSPKNGRCVSIFGRSSTGQWQVFDCNLTLAYICQKSAVIEFSKECGANWEKRPNSDYCYQFHDEAKSYTEALQTCRRQNGSLVSIKDRAEQNYLTGRVNSMSSNVLWIGATERSIEGGWSWSDGTPFSYLNWNSGEPDISDSLQDCAAMFTDTSRWNDFYCSTPMGFICKKTADIYTPAATPSTVSLPAGQFYICPDNWIAYNNHCYWISAEAETWTTAQTRCSAKEAFLTSISSKHENDFIASHAIKDVWIGFNNRRLHDTYEWADGSNVQFSNWAVHEPSTGTTLSCVTLKTDYWYTSSCDMQFSYVCRKPMQVSSVTNASPDKVGCEMPNSLGHDSYCYHFVDHVTKTWDDAESYCRTIRGNLATINDRFVHYFINGELVSRTNALYYWIGLSDVTSPGTYMWSSGSHLLYTAWNSKHTGNERRTCVAIQTTKPVGPWSNLYCNSTLPFVCQFPRKGFTTTTTTMATTTIPIPCPNEWERFENTCYKVHSVETEKRPWIEARQKCLQYGGDLASIHTKSFNDALLQAIKMSTHQETASPWIGLTDANTEGSWQWSDGTPLDFTDWGYNEPNDYEGEEDCGTLRKSIRGWNDQGCWYHAPFICSIPRGTPLKSTMVPPTTTEHPKCQDTDWLFKGGYCYYWSLRRYGSDAPKTWYEAQRFCQRNGADLVSVSSREENDFLAEYLYATGKTDKWFWIGLHKVLQETFVWTDSSPLVYENWRSNQPDDWYGRERCVAISSNHGKWNDDSCENVHGYICRKLNESTPTDVKTTITPIIQGGCPPGFKGLDNKCYIVGNHTTTGIGGHDVCSNVTSRNTVFLASITSPQEQAFVMTLLENISGDVLIGLRKQKESNRYVWQSNEEVKFTYWANREPSSYFDCVTMQVDESEFGKWKTISCYVPKAYLCQTLKHTSYPSKPDTESNGCSLGYHNYRDSCYRTYNENTSWTDAQEICKQDGGNLVSLRDIHELAKVQFFMSKEIGRAPGWIGMFFDKELYRFIWADGWRVTIAQWGSREPRMQRTGSCVTMNDGMWAVSECNDTKPFTCKISSATPPPIVATIGHCENSSWEIYGDFCYEANPQDLKSWHEANYACKRKNMELLSPHSLDEHNFLLQFIKDKVAKSVVSSYPSYSSHHRTVWPLFYNNIDDEYDEYDGFVMPPKQARTYTVVWLGLRRDVGGEFVRSDGSPSDFFLWADREPNNHFREVENCAALNLQTNNWSALPCSGQRRGYVCKANKRMPITTTPTMTAPATTESTHSIANYSSYSEYTYESHLSDGGKAGIIIAVICVIVIVVGVVILVRRRMIGPCLVRQEEDTVSPMFSRLSSVDSQ